MLHIDHLEIEHVRRAGAFSGRKARRAGAEAKPFRVRTPDIRIKAGQIIAIAGPNGSGKSTLLQGIVGFLEPVGGAVRIEEGRDPTWKSVKGFLGRKLKVGVVAQTNSLDNKLTVSQNLELAGRLYGLEPSERSARVERLLRVARLEVEGQRPVGELSGGQKRRIDIARALMSDPELLLLDEAAASLDQVSTEATWAYLRTHLDDRGTALRSIIFVSHQEKELEAADAFILMRDGKASSLISRLDVDSLNHQDHIVLGLRAGSDDGQVSRLRERLVSLSDSAREGGQESSFTCESSTSERVFSLHIPNGRSVVPQIFSWPESAVIETTELRPESLVDRLERMRSQILPEPLASGNSPINEEHRA